MKPSEVASLIEEKGILVVDLKFNDLPGLWQHFSIPASELTDSGSIWEDGIGFDGSSIRGFQKIQESDMILMPDPATAIVDPVTKIPTLSIICDIYDPITKQPYTRDPRYVAKKAGDKPFAVAVSLMAPGSLVYCTMICARPLNTLRFHSGRTGLSCIRSVTPLMMPPDLE